MFTSVLRSQLVVVNARIISKYYFKINYEVTYLWNGYEIKSYYQKFDSYMKFTAHNLN